MGHLALDVETGELELRHTLAPTWGWWGMPEQIEDVVDIMLGECEYCFPTIYQVAKASLPRRMRLRRLYSPLRVRPRFHGGKPDHAGRVWKWKRYAGRLAW